MAPTLRMVLANDGARPSARQAHDGILGVLPAQDEMSEIAIRERAKLY